MRATARKNTIIKGKPLPENPLRLPLENLRRYAPGEGNPLYGDSYVTRAAFVNWSPDLAGTKAEIPKLSRIEGPFTLSAGPVVEIFESHGFPPLSPGIRRREMGDMRNRVTVSLGECAGGPSEGQDLYLGVKFDCPMLGYQKVNAPITIEQALSFEEAVRAVFEAARQTGLLPMGKKSRKRAQERRVALNPLGLYDGRVFWLQPTFHSSSRISSRSLSVRTLKCSHTSGILGRSSFPVFISCVTTGQERIRANPITNGSA